LKRDKIINKENNPVNQKRQHSLVNYQSQYAHPMDKSKIENYQTMANPLL